MAASKRVPRLELAPEAMFDHFIDLSGRLLRHGNAALKLSAAGAAERGMPALFVSLADAAKAARAGVKSGAGIEPRAEAVRQVSE
jgi:hypothetical protein